ncbi:MAG: DUF2339 domain-containing protein [Sedimentisphaerales bacterium]|nr:DUF2339 domain-containing protein [Sedimentisphaerales bacterium]
MEDFVGLLIFLAVVCLLSAPMAVILSLVALHRIARLRREMESRAIAPSVFDAPQRPARLGREPLIVDERPPVQAPPAASLERIAQSQPTTLQRQSLSLEQRIGTRWVLAAGVIILIFAVGFFLKYAYDRQWIGPLGRVAVAASGGGLALGIGELTRRRGYDVVAKGVTALGFAILYATVFAAHRWYDLIDSALAYGLAISLTVAAMSYAVLLNEVVAALLALVGGYVTPVVLSTGANEPTTLFGYVLVLSVGAILCAYWRRWAPVNLLAFAGTVVLYTGWFERFYRPVMLEVSSPPQLAVALFWLAVFFLIFLALPLLHTLKKRINSALQDMVLVLADAAVVFYYFWTILVGHHRQWLALCSLLMGGAYLAMTGLVFVRCRQDADLRHALLAVALVFVTLAVPLYFETYAVTLAWAALGVVLAVIALRYRSRLLHLAAGLLLALTIGRLVSDLPLHRQPFRAILNADFAIWCFVAAAALTGHVLYRLDRGLEATVRSFAVQGLYAVGLLLLSAALTMEMWYHARLNFMSADTGFFVGQMLLVLPLFMLLFVARPICPRGLLCRLLGGALGAAASIYLVFMYPQLHEYSFTIFLNGGFIRAGVLVAGLFTAAWLLRRSEREQADDIPGLPKAFVLAAIIVLWVLLTEEVWLYCRAAQTDGNWQLLAHMYISIAWALYATALIVVGFWRNVRVLRYLALAIFLLLLAKIFLLDTRQLESIYRIAGFLATGLALVGVSYLYQYLKKQGFFDKMLSDKSTSV